MMKQSRITFRVSSKVKSGLVKLSKLYGISLSSLVHEGILLYLEQDKKIDPKIKKALIDEIKRMNNYKDAVDEWRQHNRNSYLLPNVVRNVMNKAQIDVFMSGNINLKDVLTKIAHAENVYKNFTPSAKKIFKDDMTAIRKLKDKHYLYELLEISTKMKQLDMAKGLVK